MVNMKAVGSAFGLPKVFLTKKGGVKYVFNCKESVYCRIF
jgi:hypothetical protein